MSRFQVVVGEAFKPLGLVRSRRLSAWKHFYDTPFDVGPATRVINKGDHDNFCLFLVVYRHPFNLLTGFLIWAWASK